LTESDALDLACGVPEIQNGVLKEDFKVEYNMIKGKINQNVFLKQLSTFEPFFL
jgi:hypothetical protein